MASSKEQICGSSFGTVPFSGQLLECFQPFLPRYVFIPHCVGSLCYHCYHLCFSFFTFFFLDVKCNYNKPLSHLILSRTRMLYLDSKISANSCCFKGKKAVCFMMWEKCRKVFLKIFLTFYEGS